MSTSTKKKMLDAAVLLFNAKGYGGTSVRAIAQKADVNPALISYYFKNKDGLLEELAIDYFEGYMDVLGKAMNEVDRTYAPAAIKEVIVSLLEHQRSHAETARFIYRELTLDSMLAKEVASTYLAKEKYAFSSLFEQGIRQKHLVSFPVAYTIMQLKTMLMTPYLQKHYLTNVLYVFPHEPYFHVMHQQQVCGWIDQMTLAVKQHA
ncbi:forespore capture DNA-binding protein RefZ [Aureibacillus halotolerans]|uniref:TetR family transcriptional regulator n=1 Tax=Aureibacillus halotolerans TaxID=1508390 RepID=A0A4R6TYR4_9BACI|nr:forespore capture DNA-binding protein RefZ [Aureibacillus halotolerans]TDQ39098.1 TetR family transcriptional regulator [Aureibacillus halotolerans]